MSGSEIFRKVSLERLSSPEKLDTLTRVTTSRGWLALSGIVLLLLVAVAWGWWGSMPVTVKGEGMLVNRGGITNVVSLGAGQVTEIFVSMNEHVEAGQVIASVSQPLAATDVINSRRQLADLQAQHEKVVRFARKDLNLQLAGFEAQKEATHHSINGLEKRGEFYRMQLEKQLSLKEKGLIVPAKVENTREALTAINEQIESLKVKLADIRTQENLAGNRAEDAVNQSLLRIRDLERAVAAGERKVTTETNVVSTLSGKVVEMKTVKGAVVAAGTPVISVEPGKRNLEAIVYVSEAEGKMIRQGMRIEVSPSSVRREEYGSIVGSVLSVSEYPTSAAGIMAVLGNEQLVQRLVRNGAPYTVQVRLERDDASPNGFRWSSGKGPATAVVSGTLCHAEIIVERKRPLGMVIPCLKQTRGG